MQTQPNENSSFTQAGLPACVQEFQHAPGDWHSVIARVALHLNRP
jgi:hypothetical protein